MIGVYTKDDSAPVDLLASLFRSAVARRSPDALLTVSSVVGSVVEIDARELTIVARVGDGGPRPNPLWSRWVGYGRTLELADPAVGPKRRRGKQRAKRKQ